MRNNTLSRAIVAVFCLFALLAFGACKKGADDATITANVKNKLGSDGLNAVNVVTNDGVVTLSGVVNTEADKSRAETDAKSVEGVKNVTNNLTVKPAVQPKIDEASKVKTQVEDALKKIGVTTVTVSVSSDGVVTLTGDVPKNKLQDVMKAANEAHPKKVENKMNIK